MSGDRPKRLTVNAAFFQEIKEDHHQLQKLLTDIEQLIENHVYLNHHPRVLVELIDRLVDQLGLHFSLEEAYGYFEHTVEDVPRFHDQAMKLRSQHNELYTMIQRIAEATAEECNKVEPQVSDLVDQFMAFYTAFKAHESAELNLIVEALNRDMGGGD